MVQPKLKQRRYRIPFLPAIFRTNRLMLAVFVFVGLFMVSIYTYTRPYSGLFQTAHAATADHLNFQARLQQSAGAVVPDGDYHIEFKLYDTAAAGASSQGVCVGGGTDDCLWVETRTTGNLVRVRNGYFSVNLGSVTSLPGSIDWSQDIWITMNVGGSAGSASWDGEMTPRIKLTAVPYAQDSGKLQGRAAGDFVQLDPGASPQNINTSNAAIAINQQGTGRLLRLQNNGVDVFVIQNGGWVGIGDPTPDATLDLQVISASDPGLLIQGHVSQSADLMRVISSGSTEYFSIDASGNIYFTQLNCTANTNGGALTVDGSGQVTCSDDDGGLGGGSTTLQGAYDADITGDAQINTASAKDILFSLSDSVTDSDFRVVIEDNSTSTVSITRADGAGISDPAQLLLLNNADTSRSVSNGLVVQSAAGGITDAIDVSDADIVNAINVGANTIFGTTAIIDFNNFDVDNSGNVIAAGNATLQGGSATIGTASQLGQLVLHDGNGQTSVIRAGDSVGSLTFTLPTTTGANGQCLKNSATPGVLTFANCNNGSGGGGAITLQDAYDVSSNPELVLDATRGALTVRDNSTPIGANLFEVQNNAGSVTYLGVSATGTVIAGNLDVSGNTTLGDAANDSITVQGTNVSIPNDINIDSNTFFIDSSSNDIGIRTSTPQYALQVASGGFAIGENPVTGGYTGLTVGLSSVSGGQVLFQGVQSSGSTYGNIKLNSLGGNVGIGVTGTPAALLSVGGTSGSLRINTSGAITAATGIASSGSIQFSNFNCSAANTFLTTDASGNLSCAAASSGSGVTDLQGAYDGGSSIVLGANGAVSIQDNATPLGAALFEVSNNGGGTDYLNVSAATTAVGNNLSVSGTSTFTGTATFNGSVVLAANQTINLTGGTTANRPASPTEGMLFYDTDTKQLLVYNGTKWIADSRDAYLVAANDSSAADKAAADYIADGTDDQVEINNALSRADPTSAISGARKSGKVYLFAGTYTTHRTASGDATIFIPNNTTLAGAGRGTLIELADIDTTDNLIENSDTSTGTGVTIRDLRLDGRRDLNTLGNQYGVYLTGMGDYATARQGAKILSMWVDRFRVSGIFLDNSELNTINNNHTSLNDDSGIGLYNSIGNTVTGNVSRSDKYGVLIFANSNTISSNTIVGSTTAGIYMLTANNNIVSNNILNDSGGATNNNAIFTSNSDSNTITGNSITDTSATTSNYAINISNAISDTNYLADNTLGGGAINDAGTGTIYAGQVDGSGNYDIQPAGTISLLKATNITGTLTVSGAVQFSNYNCSTNANGGKLTTDASGNLTCADDNGGSGGITDLQGAYDGGSTIVLGSNGGITIQDNATPLGASLFRISNNGGGTNYLNVTAATTTVGNNLSINGSATLGDAISDTITFTGYVNSDILPSSDDTYTLGSSSNRWQDLYLGPSSLHIGADGNDSIISYDTALNQLQFDADGDSSSELTVTDSGSVIVKRGVRVGGSADNTAGTIRWNGTDFQGYDGTAWYSLTGKPAGYPTFIASAKSSTTSGTLTINKPAGTAEGDLLVWASAHRNSGVSSAPSGFTQIFQNNTSNGNDFTYVAYKFATSSEPTSYAATVNGVGEGVGMLMTYRDVGAYNSFAWQQGSPEVTPSTSVTEGGLIIGIASNVFTGTPWTGFSESEITVADIATRASNESIMAGYEIATTTGSTTSRTPNGDDGTDDGYATVTFNKGSATASLPTLQESYDGGSSIVLGSNGAVSIQDNATPLGATLFEVANNGGGTDYLNVSAATTAVGNNLTVSGTSTFTGLATFNGGVTLTASQSLTLTGSGAFPGSPSEGQIYFRSDEGKLYIYANSAWVDLTASGGGGTSDGKTATVIVAASDSSAAAQASADYVTDGTDDQVEINAALAAAAGGLVYMHEGTYTTHQTNNGDATIFIPNNTTLAGAGRGTLIQLGDIDATDNLIENTDTTTGAGVLVRDMNIDGQNDLNTTGVQKGILFNNLGGGLSNLSGGEVANIYAKGFRTYAISLYSSENSKIINNEIDIAGGQTGIYIEDYSEQNIINANKIHGDSTSRGISLYWESNNNIISDNISFNNGYSGINISSSDGNSIANNIAEGSNTGIYITGSHSNSATGNTVKNSIYNGFVLASNSSSNAISSNAIVGSSSRGISIITGSVNNIINGNSIKDSGDSVDNNAIYLDASDSNTITNNTITDTSATTTNYAINISNSTSDTNYLADNILGGGSINDAGTGTIYGGQVDDSNNFVIQPAGSIDLSATTDITGNLTVSGSVQFSNFNCTTYTNGGVLTTDASGNLTCADDDVGTGDGVGALNLQEAYDGGSSIVLGANGAVSIQDNSTPLATTLFEVSSNGGGTDYLNVSSDGISVTGLAVVSVGVATSLLDTASATTLNIGTTNATQINMNKNVVLAASQSLTLTGSGSFPSSPSEGQIYFRSDEGKLYIYANSAWTDLIASGGGGTMRVRLSPEFAGGTLSADGTNNSGVMSADHASGRNYYEWTSSNASTQDYDIIVSTMVPSDYTGSFGSFYIANWRDHNTNASATVTVEKEDGTSCLTATTMTFSGTTSTWAEHGAISLSCTPAANDILVIKINVQASNNANVRIGAIRFDYNN